MTCKNMEGGIELKAEHLKAIVESYDIKLVPEFKVKWLEKLRSGEIEQGWAKLRSINDEFCCLGISCDIVDSEQWEEAVHGRYYFHRLGGGWENGFPSPDVLSEMFQTDKEGWEGGAEIVSSTLAGLNDSGASFERIADLIDELL